ncbi:MAG: hypothetical protein GY722_03970 [bacterium]|nr:hypothetical protein [bacterium]
MVTERAPAAPVVMVWAVKSGGTESDKNVGASLTATTFTVATVPSAVVPEPESVTLVKVTVRAVVDGALLVVLLKTAEFNIVLTVASSVPAWVMVTTGVAPALETV